MAKTDVDELPARLPKKRKAVERLSDVWIARWASGEGELSDEDRDRVIEERDRRKALRKVREFKIGLIVPPEGVTADQAQAVLQAVGGASELHHGGVPRKLHNALRELCPIVHHNATGWRYSDERNKEVIRDVDAVVAAVKEPGTLPYATPGVWSMIGYARNRDVPVTIVRPNGDREEKC